jgi:hypothetical protein
MTLYLLLIVGIVTLFYAALPGLGAFLVRGQWRMFRNRVTAVSRYPTASPLVIARERTASSGFFRFFGTLEAIQGDDRIWITNGRFSVAADLRGVRVYMIPEAGERGIEARAGSGPEAAEIRSVPWSRIFSLPEGTPVFVAGSLFAEEGRGVFRDRGSARLLVVIHDCPRESIILRAIGSGRQRNEFVNAFTLPSVAIGSLLQVLLAFSLPASPDLRVVALIALTAGLAPVSPFLPPGFPLYFAYRSFWKKARLMRAQRDVIRLPLRYFPPSAQGPTAKRATLLPDMEPYLMIRGMVLDDDAGIIESEGARIALPPGIHRLEVDFPRRKSGKRSGETPREYVAFAAYRENDDGIELSKPADPMAELVLIPGDPESISRASETTARWYELVSGLLISLNLAVNVPLVFLLLSLLIR